MPFSPSLSLSHTQILCSCHVTSQERSQIGRWWLSFVTFCVYLPPSHPLVCEGQRQKVKALLRDILCLRPAVMSQNVNKWPQLTSFPNSEYVSFFSKMKLITAYFMQSLFPSNAHTLVHTHPQLLCTTRRQMPLIHHSVSSSACYTYSE